MDGMPVSLFGVCIKNILGELGSVVSPNFGLIIARDLTTSY